MDSLKRILARTAAAAVLFAFLPALCPAAETRWVIQSGHVKAVNALAHDPIRNFLFSSSDDGTVRIANAETKELLYCLRVSFLPLNALAVHPSKSLFAVLEIHGPTSSVIHVMDWEKGTTLYSLSLKEIPLFLEFSPKGTYLIYGRTEWRSIIFCDALTGGQLPLLEDGFGIVSFIAVSRNEDKVMAYQPSGKITYWEIATGKALLKKPVETLASLQAFGLSDNMRYLSASQNDRLVVVDTVNGSMAAKTGLSGITQTLFLPGGKEIGCISKTAAGSRFSRYSWKGNTLTANAAAARLFGNENVGRIAYGGKKIFYTGEEGAIGYSADPGDAMALFSENLLQRVTDLAFLGDRILFGFLDSVVSFPLDALGRIRENPDNDPGLVRFANPFREPVGLSPYSPSTLLIWSQSETKGQFAIIDGSTGEPKSPVIACPSPLLQMECLADGILSLDRNGTCSVYGKKTLTAEFQYRSQGLNKLAYASDNALIGAKSRLTSSDSPLIRLNPRTEEIVPITAGSYLYFDIVYDAASRILYSLSVERKENGSVTFLKTHSGGDLEKEISLFAFYDEDLQAAMALDRKTGLLYTSLGNNEIQYVKSGQMNVFARLTHPAGKLYLTDGMLISLNRDLSVSVFNKETKALVLDLYFFKDGSLAAFFQDNTLYSYLKGAQYIRGFDMPEAENAKTQPAPQPETDKVISPEP